MSKLKLNIYTNKRDENGKREISKTYETDTCDMLYGPIEDLLGTLDIEKLTDDKELIKLIVSAIKQVKPILKDIFYGLTDEELKMTILNEVIAVVLDIFKFSVKGLLADDNIKNLMREQK